MSTSEKWAIITGASAGIGKALAFEFAKGGFNLFLTARNIESLAVVADNCRQKFNIKIEIFSADLSELNSTDKLIKAISNKKFEILINNAGSGLKGDFAETNIDDELAMLNVQLAAMLKLTKAVLPKMIEAKSGKILNVASVYSFAPVPMQSVYSASKAFMLSFSTALQNEVQDSGITVTVLCPGVTQTEFRTRAGITDKTNSGMTAENVAEIAFTETMRGKHIVITGFQNKVFVMLAKHFPAGLFTHIVRFINNQRGVNKTKR